MSHGTRSRADGGDGLASRFRRLSLADRSYLRLERPETPMHVAGLGIVEAGPLAGEGGQVDLAAVRERLLRRLARVPELRRVVHRPPPLCGPALWVDDPRFAIEQHVRAVAIDSPGDEASLLRAVELLLRPALDRSRPPWELWLLTGLEDGRLGVVFKMHHVIADGLAAIALAGSLLDLDAEAPDPAPAAWSPEPAPGGLALLADNARCRAVAAATTLGHPFRLARRAATAAAGTGRALRGLRAAPRTSLNAIPGAPRHVRAVHLELERARSVAHTHGARVNDVLLAVVSGGVRELLAGRGELTGSMDLNVSVPATLRRAGAARELGNAVGALIVPVPVGEPDAVRRLEMIAARTRMAKATQRPSQVEGLMAWLAAAGLALPLARRQRLVNLFVTNVPGPRDALFFLGARIEDLMAVTGPQGNVTLAFTALSYRGRLNVVVDADAAACPDVDVLAAGMAGAWAQLARGAAQAV